MCVTLCLMPFKCLASTKSYLPYHSISAADAAAQGEQNSLCSQDYITVSNNDKALCLLSMLSLKILKASPSHHNFDDSRFLAGLPLPMLIHQHQLILAQTKFVDESFARLLPARLPFQFAVS